MKHITTPHCGSCKMYDHGECWGYGNKKVKAEHVCDSWAAEHSSRTAAPYDRQLAKYVYDPKANHILIGEMGREEGEHPTHDQLRYHPVWGEGLPPQTTWGTIGQNGYATANGSSSYHEGYKTEEAVRRAVPGAQFTNPRDMLIPEWAIGDPQITYIGEPPAIQPANEEDTRWDFQANLAYNG